MKSCPACQRTFPDNSPDSCPYDGTRLVSDAAAPQQQNWQPPPPQPQNWGGQYQPSQGQAPAWPPQSTAPSAKSNGLSLTALMIGIVSAIGLALVFLASGDVISLSYYPFMISFWGSAALGVLALLLGVFALISKRQRSKWMAVVGLCLGIPAIAFCTYALITRPEILQSF